jgi:hypothetical protein
MRHDTGCRDHASATRMQRWGVEHLGTTCRKLSTSACGQIHAPGLLQWPPPSTLPASARLSTQEYSPGILPNTSDYPCQGGDRRRGARRADTLPVHGGPPGFQGQVRVLVSCPNRRSLWRGALASARGRSPRKAIKSAARSRCKAIKSAANYASGLEAPDPEVARCCMTTSSFYFEGSELALKVGNKPNAHDAGTAAGDEP